MTKQIYDPANLGREIEEIDAAMLRKACGLPATELLPVAVLNRYWAAKIVCGRLGVPVRSEFVRIAAETGYGRLTTTEANPDVASMFLRKDIKAGHPVMVNWRNEQKGGTIVGVKASREVVVLIDGIERTVPAELVALSAAA